MNIYLIFILILSALFLITLTFAIWQCRLCKEKDERLKRQVEIYDRLLKEHVCLQRAMDFRQKKAEETNEKIDSLHNGVLSADDILPKRKG